MQIRPRIFVAIVTVTMAGIAASCGGSSPTSTSSPTPPTAKPAVTSGSTTTTSPDVGSSGANLSVHVYLCQEYAHNGVPDLETTTDEISGGTVSITGVTSNPQSNPYSANVNSGTYTVGATTPPGYYFTECPYETVTPTFTNGDQSGSGSVTVSSSAQSAAFYVVAFQTASCSATNGGVSCALPDTLGLPFFPLNTLLTEANGVSSSVSASTPIAITAYGGNGGQGDTATAGAYAGGSGGGGGEAQTALTSIANYESANRNPILYYYLGYQGISYKLNGSDKVGGFGGSSTIVSPDDFATGSIEPCINGYDSCNSATNVLLDAAGGGGGGQGGDSDDGGSGGAGGSAIATTSAAAYAVGGNGSNAGGNGGHGGHGAGTDPESEGTGGAYGHGGNGTTNKDGGTGSSGIGGLGGSMHTSGGPSKAIPWANAGYLSLIGGTGSGGEGEWAGTGVSDGGSGSGGGGFGGGGAGGSGGATYAGGGGSAGGSYAIEAQLIPEAFTAPGHTVWNGQVYVTFVLN